MPTTHPPCDRLLTVLTCPLCPARLGHADRALRCANRHTFNIARQRYISLLAGHRRPASADTAAMVQARAAFLQAGHYAPLAGTLAELAGALTPSDGTILDAGVGTGYYLTAVLDALPAAMGLGLDTSPYALRVAARAHPRTEAVSWDVWQRLPVHTDSVHLVLNVFAPRNGGEFHRVLRPDGALLVTTPTPRHLLELHHRIGGLTVDPNKEDRLRGALSAHFRQERTEPVEYALALTDQDITNLVTMSPTAHHISPTELRGRIAGLDIPLRVTVSCTVSVYRPRLSTAAQCGPSMGGRNRTHPRL